MNADDLRRMRERIAQLPRNEERKRDSASKLLTEGSIQEAAPIIIGYNLRGHSYTARHIWTDSPRLQATYETANSLGTVLGLGVKNQGMKLHSDKQGKGSTYYACRENALLAAGFVLEQLPALAPTLGFPDAETLWAALEALPPLATMPSKAPTPTPIPGDTNGKAKKGKKQSPAQHRTQTQTPLPPPRDPEQARRDLHTYIVEANDRRSQSGLELLMEDPLSPEYGTGKPAADQEQAREFFLARRHRDILAKNEAFVRDRRYDALNCLLVEDRNSRAYGNAGGRDQQPALRAAVLARLAEKAAPAVSEAPLSQEGGEPVVSPEAAPEATEEATTAPASPPVPPAPPRVPLLGDEDGEEGDE